MRASAVGPVVLALDWAFLVGTAWAVPQLSSPGSQVCPEGMVLVGGDGHVGMRGQPYGIVETAHLKTVDAPEKGCPGALQSTPGATVCWVQTDLVDPVIPVHAVSLPAFCIDAEPIPGKGYPYAKDGMSVWDAHKLDVLLREGRFGRRRMCSTTEFQAAVAGLAANQRFVFGDEFQQGNCEEGLIGEKLRCKNEHTGVSEYGAVHSHWTVADKTFIDNACPRAPCQGAGNRPLSPGMYIVAGGTDRAQTRQAPMTPHTWHDHGDATVDACGFHGWDDQPAICADPGQDSREAAAAWAAFLADVRRSGSIRAAISNATGGPICPG